MQISPMFNLQPVVARHQNPAHWMGTEVLSGHDTLANAGSLHPLPAGSDVGDLMRLFVYVAAALAVAGLDSEAGSIASRIPDIALHELSSTRWRVEYRLERPAQSLHFVRTAHGYRQAFWRAPGFQIVYGRDGSVRAERRDGAAFDRLVADIDARYLDLPRNYSPFAPFSDGGMLVYTGYLHACADAPCVDGSSWRLSVAPQKRRGAFLHGVRLDQTVFTDQGDGTNIFVGMNGPDAHPEYAAYLDRGLPASFRKTFERTTPRLIEYFDRRLGALPSRPTYAVSMDPSPRGRGYESRGAALPDQVSIHLIGDRWAEPTMRVEPGFLPWYLAHETAHLYQRIEDRSVTDHFMAEAWVQEGGAEALAALAVEALHPELGAYVRERVHRAAEDCGDGLDALRRPLNASGDAGAYENYYVCGLAMHMAIDADIRVASGGRRDLFDLWRLFLDETSAGAPWSAQTFLGAARRAGASDETVRLVSTLARTRTAAAGDALMSRLPGVVTTQKPR